MNVSFREGPSHCLNSRYSLSFLIGVTEIVSKIETVKKELCKNTRHLTKLYGAANDLLDVCHL